MNEPMHIMREGITRLTQLLAGKGIEVRQQGVSAYVETDDVGRPTLVNLPFIPDNATPELIDAIRGFLDHEVAHLLFTDFPVMMDAIKVGAAGMLNLIEDSRIERAMQQRFQGSAENLARTGRFFLDKFTTPRYLAALAAGDMTTVQGVLMVPLIRSMAGQTVFTEFMRDKMPFMQDVYDKIDDLTDAIANVKSTRDCLAIAQIINQRLREGEPDASPGNSPGDAEAGESDAAGTSGKAKADPAGTGRGKGKGKVGAKEADTEPDADDPADQTDGEPSMVAKTDGETTPPAEPGFEEPADNQKSGESGTSESEDGHRDGEKGESGEQDDKDEQDEQGEQDDQAESLDNPTPALDGADHVADKAGDTDAENNSHDADHDLDIGDEDPGDGDDTAPSGHQNAEIDTASVVPDDNPHDTEPHATLGHKPNQPGERTDSHSPLWDAIDKETARDYDATLSSLITDSATAAVAAADYLVFTKDHDVIEPLHVGRHYDPLMLVRLEEQVRHLVGPLQKDLERAISARSMTAYSAGHRSGRLHAANLSRLALGDCRVFRRKHEVTGKDVAVELVVDMSGSMNGIKLTLATQAAFALASVLDRIGIANEVICFTTSKCTVPDLAALKEEEERIGRRYSRIEALYMPILKGFQERMSVDVKKRFGWLPNVLDLRENVDGESIEIAARRLLARRETGKVMMVLSDGDPACFGPSYPLRDHLTQVVSRVARAGIDVIGIGIMSSAVSRYYPKHLVLNDVNDLPGVVMKQLRALIVH